MRIRDLLFAMFVAAVTCLVFVGAVHAFEGNRPESTELAPGQIDFDAHPELIGGGWRIIKNPVKNTIPAAPSYRGRGGKHRY